MKLHGERGRGALVVGCVYMPTDSASVRFLEECYSKQKDGVLSFRKKGEVVLLEDFNARVSRAVDSDNVIGMFGEDTCNSSGNRLISFLYEVDMVVCNGRRLVSDPEWTRVRPSLDQKSIIDYIHVTTDTELMVASGGVYAESTDTGCLDHFLV